MCGIFGAFNIKESFTNKDLTSFIDATNIVTHRGSDGWGYTKLNADNTTSEDTHFNIFLGHRRLSIIDLSNSVSAPSVINFTSFPSSEDTSRTKR